MITFPNTITKVLEELHSIVETSIAQNNRTGYFAYVYYRTTLEIKRAIDAGEFENAKRMEEFDVVFANLYLKAYHDYLAKRPVSQVWQIAFEANHKNFTILQHIMLGMNAHINLDLGIAAGRVMQGQNILALESDFMKVNAILASLVNELQGRIARVSPLFFVLDWVGGRKDEQVINFSMVKARQYAWQLAQDLWNLEGTAYKNRLQAADHLSTKLSQGLTNPPGWLMPFVLGLIKRFESQTTSKVIEAMKS